MTLSSKASERLRRTCVRAIMVLEDTHEPVMRGQRPGADPKTYRRIAQQLRLSAQALIAAADEVSRTLDQAGIAGSKAQRRR
ncbi:MAG TPA: hypothetical protein VII56_04470 [Rhizomicrobium sp.]